VLDVRKLLLLREVEARGSIAGAAQALNYTRSAVSQGLSALEAETGGKLLVGHGEVILSQLEAAESQLQEYSGQVYGDLRVGVPFHEGPMLVPTLVAMRGEHPGLHITLHDVRGTEARQAVRLAQLDVVVAARYGQLPEPEVPGLSEEPLARDRIRLAVPPGHPLAAGNPVRARPLADFGDERWIYHEDTALGRLTRHACAGAGFAPRQAAVTDDLQAALGLVARGWGVALVPDLVPDRPGFPVARIELAGAVLAREVSLVVRAGTAACPSVAALLTAVRRDLRDDREPAG
jgi:DNA-binding transcriptional LysR family regulator